MLLNKITRFEIYKNAFGEQHMTINGFRTDIQIEFTIDLIKKNNSWEKFRCMFNTQLPLRFFVKENPFSHSSTDLQWDVLIDELLNHPKIRLHALF